MPKYINAEELSLDEWLAFLKKPPADAQFIDYEFPTQRHRDEYFATLPQRSDAEVMQMIRRLLIPSGTLGGDKRKIQLLPVYKRDAPDIFVALLKTELYRRLIRWTLARGEAPPPWEGITWIIDLLPHFPREALAALSSYILAHAQFLPDGRYRGLGEAGDLIRLRFIGTAETQADKLVLLRQLDPTHFECLTERLYAARGYHTSLTPKTADGGCDVIAERKETGYRERLMIECKRYESTVGVRFVRSLLGVVSDSKANKGVLVTTGRFTRPARVFAETNPRLELIDGFSFVLLCNEYLGPAWPDRVERLVTESLLSVRSARGQGLA